MDGEKFYAYFYCNEWKERSSMSLQGVFDEETLRQVIVEDLKNNDVELDDRPPEEIMTMTIREINDLLKYGYVMEIELNERT